jgi:hypothetical protein
MKVDHVELLVEEPSIEAALGFLLPKILATTSYTIHPHQGKKDLLKKLPAKLKGYASWIPSTWRIVVVVDRDDDDCEQLMTHLEKIAGEAGLATRSVIRKPLYRVVNRLAIEELEAWYFGDWEAVRAAYPRVPATIPLKAEYREPDAIKGGTWEAFERVLQKAGYFTGGIRKIEAARSVAKYMAPTKNSSPSFRKFWNALLEIASP